MTPGSAFRVSNLLSCRQVHRIQQHCSHPETQKCTGAALRALLVPGKLPPMIDAETKEDKRWEPRDRQFRHLVCVDDDKDAFRSEGIGKALILLIKIII